MKSDTKQIGECRYTVTQVTSGIGLEAAARMMNVLGPGLNAAPDEGGFDGATIGAVLGRVLVNPALSGQLKWFVQVFAEVTQVSFPDGRTLTLANVYETHFAGEVVNQLAWLRFAFETNMGSFFAIARKVVESFRAQPAVATDSTSQNFAKPNGASGV